MSSTAPAAAPARGANRCAAVARALGEAVLGSAPETCDAWLVVEHPGRGPPTACRRTSPRRSWSSSNGCPRTGSARSSCAAPATAARCPRTRSTSRTAAARTALRCGWSSAKSPICANCWTSTSPRCRAASARTGGRSTASRSCWCARTANASRAALQFGRPTVRTLHAAYGEPVWETTHVGGDRFAANLVALPHGSYHGLVTEPVAAEVGAACLRGEVDLAHYRGRMGLPYAAQAAEWFVRSHTGILTVEAVRTLGHVERADGGTTVDLTAEGRMFRVTVRTARSGCPRLTSCSQGSVTDPDGFVLDDLRELSAPAG
ncbi:hypothetical protein ACU686_19460 [Yinghuangia aomiensis]